MMQPAADKRKHPRIQVQFRSHFSARGQMLAGDGDLKDLSVGGCRIQSTLSVPTGTHLELCVYTGNDPAPMIIDETIVRWSQTGEFGLEFSKMRKDAQRRLTELCRILAPMS
jgi:hypothetical protein